MSTTNVVSYKSHKLSIPTPDGYTLDCNLYTPTDNPSNNPTPIIILAHGFGALQSMCLDKFAKHFSSNLPIASLTFDYRGFGNSTGPITEYVNPWYHINDWHTVINYVKNEHLNNYNIDPFRISIWGTSFSGGHVLYIASEDPTIQCCISQVPFVGGIESALQIPIIQQLKIIPYAIADILLNKFTKLSSEPIRIPVVSSNNNDIKLLSSDDSYPAFQQLSPTHDFSIYKYNGNVPARVAIEMLFYRPLWYARHIIPKTLLMAAKNDKLIPYKSVESVAQQIFQCEFDNTTLDSHFQPYVDKFTQAVTVQTEFLRRHLEL